MWRRYNRSAAFYAAILLLGITGGFVCNEFVHPAVPVVVMAKEAGTEYDFGPVSYDLTNLPPMENEMYAEWEGKIYYRQYSDEDMGENTRGGYFGAVPGAKKELMCMSPDGSVEQVGVDYGYDGMYIVEGRIYSQKRKAQGEGWTAGVYSCALDGSDVKEYASDEVLGVKGDRVICTLGVYGISWIDGKDGQEHVLIPDKEQDYGPKYLGATDKEVFFSRCTWNEETMESGVGLYSVDDKGKVRCLRIFTEQAYLDYMEPRIGEYITYINVSSPFITSFQILGDELYFSVGTDNGTGHSYSGSMIVCMNTDGSNCKFLGASPAAYFYLYDDGLNRSLYCSPFKDGKAVISKGTVLKGEAPPDLTIRPREKEHRYGDWAYEEPQVWPDADGRDSILAYPDTSGVCYVLLSAEESEKIGIATACENNADMMRQTIRQIEYLEERLFFTVTDLIHRENLDSPQWGYGYERGKSVCYCKNLESGEIRALYEY